MILAYESSNLVWTVLMLFCIVHIMLFPERNMKGYIGRYLRKLVRRLWGEAELTFGYFGRYFVLLMFAANVMAVPYYLALWWLGIGKDPDERYGMAITIAMVVWAVDDHINGDDDNRKRRWESVKNKVKWLWTPDMEGSKA